MSRSSTPAPTRGAANAGTSTQVADAKAKPGIAIVGIGCSAGGLDALERFLTAVRPGSGAAFVIIQHLAPDHVSALPELLQRKSSLPVLQAADRVTVAADTVYVIPPNADLTLVNGELHLAPLTNPHGPRLAIDAFFCSLAQEQREQAIGIVLSGMGQDGLLGLRAIHEHGGLTLAQEPGSAQFDSMPRGAITAGAADIIALPGDMPARIARYLHRPVQTVPPANGDRASDLNALDRMLETLRSRNGNDFSGYKMSTIGRRVERRMAIHQLETLADYERHLQANPTEQDLLFKELLIGVTRFFRDAEVWEHLGSEALPALIDCQRTGSTLRAWVVACSTGEEAYTLAMVFRETQLKGSSAAALRLQIFATDLDADAIETARKGVYPATIAAQLSGERLNRYFVRLESGDYRISDEIRAMVVFATQNVLSDPPFTRLDILCCRNLLIYFEPVLQKKLLPLFHYALNPHGLLILGSAETVANYPNLFAAKDTAGNTARIFYRLDQSLAINELELPNTVIPSTPSDSQSLVTPDNLAYLTDQLVQQRYAPAAVLVSGDGDILYFSGKTGRYLEPAAGKTNINIHAMALPGLAEALIGKITLALNTPEKPVIIKGLRLGSGRESRRLDVILQAISAPLALKGRVLIVFKEVSLQDRPRSARRTDASGADALLLELQQAREALQISQEEMQATVDALKSSNEELQSTNEELQSTNEELTTSKEELQSLNEELQTVNAELQSKVDDLTWARNDMTNLLNSTEIATVFLDQDMNLRRFTTHAERLFRLIAGDVGRPLSHIVTDLDYPTLLDDALNVLTTLVSKETVVSTRDERWFRVRIMPYRTQDTIIDGVVITFIDITEIKQLQDELQRKTRAAGATKP